MKMPALRLLAPVVLALPLCAAGQALNALRVDPQAAEPGQPVQVLVDVTDNGQSAFTCGLEVSFGDGEASTLRISRPDLPLKISHAYRSAGAYAVTAGGKLMVRGLKTALPCEGSPRAAAVVVRVATAPPAAPSTPVAPVAPVAPAAPAPVPQARPAATPREMVQAAAARYARDHDAAQAASAYRRALAADAGYLPAMLGLAAMMEAQGDLRAAAPVLEQAVRKAKPGPVADAIRLELAIANRRQATPATAYTSAVAEARVLLASGLLPQAAARAQAARALDAQRWEAYAVAGEIAWAANRPPDARRLFEAASARADTDGLRLQLSRMAATTLGPQALCGGCDVTRAELTAYVREMLDEIRHEVEQGYGSSAAGASIQWGHALSGRVSRMVFQDVTNKGRMGKVLSFLVAPRGIAPEQRAEYRRQVTAVALPLVTQFRAALKQRGYRDGPAPEVDARAIYFELKSRGNGAAPASVDMSCCTNNELLSLEAYWYVPAVSGVEDWKVDVLDNAKLSRQ